MAGFYEMPAAQAGGSHFENYVSFLRNAYTADDLTASPNINLGELKGGVYIQSIVGANGGDKAQLTYADDGSAVKAGDLLPYSRSIIAKNAPAPTDGTQPAVIALTYIGNLFPFLEDYTGDGIHFVPIANS